MSTSTSTASIVYLSVLFLYFFLMVTKSKSEVDSFAEVVFLVFWFKNTTKFEISSDIS